MNVNSSSSPIFFIFSSSSIIFEAINIFVVLTYAMKLLVYPGEAIHGVYQHNL